MKRRPVIGIKVHWFHILVALADEDRHGTGIAREVLERSGGKLQIWPVMLYRCLEEMMDEGLVSELTDPSQRPPGESGRPRFFRITKEGLGILATEANRLSDLVQVARSKMALNRAELI